MILIPEGANPIATAPRDGTQVLYWSKAHGFCVGNHPPGCYPGNWVQNTKTKTWSGESDMRAESATHWLPLPKLKESKGG